MSIFLKVFLPSIFAFFVGIILSDFFNYFAHKFQMWRKSSRSKENPDAMSVAFQKIHNEKDELKTPRGAGIIIWLSVVVVGAVFYFASYFSFDIRINLMNFISRNQTLIPFGMLVGGALVGLIEDILQVKGIGGLGKDQTSYRWFKVICLVLIAGLAALWFYYKLDMRSVLIPFDGELYLGFLFIPFFIIVTLAIFSGSVIDGIDGLAGGVMAILYSGYAFIAISQQLYDLAAFCAVVGASILAFLWFNLPPAKFYMGETGMLALTVCLASIAFLTKTVLVLPILAFPLVATTFSVIVQLISKKYFNKKVFRIAPLHHHFEALGWQRSTITMRYWIVSFICVLMGVLVALSIT